MRGGRDAVDVLRQVLQAPPAVHGVAQRGEPRRAQGGQEHGGRLVGAHDAARGHHGQNRAQRGLGRHGRGKHAAAPRIDR